VSKIEPEFIQVNKEPIDIAHVKDNQYLLGCFDGSMMLRDTRDPNHDRIFKQHLMNRATWIRSIIIDCEGKVWVGTSNGLSVYNRSFKIIMQMVPYNDKVKFYGHFRILWTDAKRRYIFWWCDRGSLKVFCAKKLKLLAKYKDMLRHPEERPNHYTFLDGNFRKVFFVTNHQHNMGMYYVLDVFQRKVHGGERSLPQSENSMIFFAHICVAFNCPSDCIVTTGISSLVGMGDTSQLESKAEISHISVFKLNSDNTVKLVDSQLNNEMKLMTIAAIVFHTPNHTRILSVLTKHVYVIDLINGKLHPLFQVKDLNRGECVHQLVRSDNYYLFVGNFGQIFKVTFKDQFFSPAATRSVKLTGQDMEDDHTERAADSKLAVRFENASFSPPNREREAIQNEAQMEEDKPLPKNTISSFSKERANKQQVDSITTLKSNLGDNTNMGAAQPQKQSTQQLQTAPASQPTQQKTKLQKPKSPHNAIYNKDKEQEMVGELQSIPHNMKGVAGNSKNKAGQEAPLGTSPNRQENTYQNPGPIGLPVTSKTSYGFKPDLNQFSYPSEIDDSRGGAQYGMWGPRPQQPPSSWNPIQKSQHLDFHPGMYKTPAFPQEMAEMGNFGSYPVEQSQGFAIGSQPGRKKGQPEQRQLYESMDDGQDSNYQYGNTDSGPFKKPKKDQSRKGK
jgi:hypothetical protein